MLFKQHDKSSPLTRPRAVLYPQNGDRIAATDSVTSLHPVHCVISCNLRHRTFVPHSHDFASSPISPLRHCYESQTAAGFTTAAAAAVAAAASMPRMTSMVCQ